MRRGSFLAAILIALLVCSESALAVRSGGHNPPTRKLEEAFKVIGGLRAESEDGCYPSPREMIAAIRFWTNRDTDVVPRLGSVSRHNVVHVIKRATRCGGVRMALRARGKLFILDTRRGDIFVRGKPRLLEESRRGGRGPLRQVELFSKEFWFGDDPDRAKRLVVRCPRGTFPLGGGFLGSPALGPDGEGLYPNSYERLGAQRGYHVTAFLLDPTPWATTPREGTLQVTCGRGLVPRSAPHKTVFVKRTETNTVIARCPSGQYLFSGGYQRTNFTTPYWTFGGNFITESRVISPQAWQVRARAFGRDGGELTAIAYCVKADEPLITEVSASSRLPPGRSATATTPPCPPGHELTSGGFSFAGSHNAFLSAAYFNDDNTWSATAFGYFGEAPALTVHGYCLEASDADAAQPPTVPGAPDAQPPAAPAPPSPPLVPNPLG